MVDDFVQPDIPRFDGDHDYQSMSMENSLRFEKLWQIIS